MPRLVAVSLYVGRAVKIDGVRHRISGYENTNAVILARDDGTVGSVSLPRAELYALIVEERASLLDPLDEDPEPPGRARELNLSFLQIDRRIDWYHKMILWRHLMPYAAMSPRSKRFTHEYGIAIAILDWVRQNSGIRSEKSWSAKTLYDDLARWRRSGYELPALQRKGVQYSPWQNRKTSYERARTVSQQVQKDYPHATATAIHAITRLRLRKEPSETSSPKSQSGHTPRSNT